MEYSRRDLSLLLPVLAAAANVEAQSTELPTKGYAYDSLPMKVNGANKSRAVLKGATHSGYPIELHMTELGPYAAPHPPHRHVHEELLMIRKGTLEVTMQGATNSYAAGSVVYVSTGVEHGWKNAGAEPAEYFVIALGSDS